MDKLNAHLLSQYFHLDHSIHSCFPLFMIVLFKKNVNYMHSDGSRDQEWAGTSWYRYECTDQY
jgi:hypothetical protein